MLHMHKDRKIYDLHIMLSVHVLGSNNEENNMFCFIYATKYKGEPFVLEQGIRVMCQQVNFA